MKCYPTTPILSPPSKIIVLALVVASVVGRLPIAKSFLAPPLRFSFTTVAVLKGPGLLLAQVSDDVMGSLEVH